MKTLVLGASLNPSRYAYLAIEKLTSHGIPTLAFGLKEGDIFGVHIENKLLPYDDIDTVTLYLNPERQAGFYDYIISLKPRRVIFNPGTENPELMEILEKNEISYEIACTLVLLSIGQY